MINMQGTRVGLPEASSTSQDLGRKAARLGFSVPRGLAPHDDLFQHLFLLEEWHCAFLMTL